MKRGEQLTLTLHDNSHPVMAITFDDWSQQASSALSPTAGWRVPMNAIEFQRLHDELTAPVTIWITLAATSVGRGWETVGHKAGIYRNRITVRTFSPP
jgi:hypothetical protein